MDAAVDVDAMARTIVDEIGFVVPTTVDRQDDADLAGLSPAVQGLFSHRRGGP